MKRLILQIIFAALAIVLAIVFYMNTLHLSKAAYQLPRILIAIVILFSVVMVIEGFLTYKKKVLTKTAAKFSTQQTLTNSGEEAFNINLGRVIVFTVFIAVYILTIERLGYFIITPIYIVATYLYLKAGSLLNIILIAIGFTVFVYVLFMLFLHLPVPMGLLS